MGEEEEGRTFERELTFGEETREMHRRGGEEEQRSCETQMREIIRFPRWSRADTRAKRIKSNGGCQISSRLHRDESAFVLPVPPRLDPVSAARTKTPFSLIRFPIVDYPVRYDG